MYAVCYFLTTIFVMTLNHNDCRDIIKIVIMHQLSMLACSALKLYYSDRFVCCNAGRGYHSLVAGGFTCSLLLPYHYFCYDFEPY
jgi:hypothetical protein